MEIIWNIEPIANARDACFYSDGSSSTMVGAISNGGRSASIYCDGIMRIYDHLSGHQATDADGLVSVLGILNDDELWEAEGSGRIEFINNPWFSIWSSSSEEVDIAHSIDEALDLAKRHVLETLDAPL